MHNVVHLRTYILYLLPFLPFQELFEYNSNDHTLGNYLIS